MLLGVCCFLFFFLWLLLCVGVVGASCVVVVRGVLFVVVCRLWFLVSLFVVSCLLFAVCCLVCGMCWFVA